MSLRRLPSGLGHRLRHPHTTVRWRLTLLYGALFLVCGAGLLAITYGLVSHGIQTTGPRAVFIKGRPFPPSLIPSNGSITAVPAQVRQREAKLPGNVRRALVSPAGKAVVNYVVNRQQVSDLHQLEVESAIALAVMALISGLLGWVVAGRVLRPLRIIIAATQEISEANLHRRLALAGPRDELRQLADTIDGLLWRLEGAFEAQRRFVANASHELRTPLTTVRALLEMVLSDPRASTETFRDTCRQVLEENEHEELLIDALLALAQGQRGISHPAPVNLTAVTHTVIDAREREARSRGLSLSESLDEATVSGDSRLIERLVSNLLDNAIRHNVADGTVSMGITTVNGDAVLDVTNTGPVIPADQIERLLAPFQRLNGERVGRDGLGLGLSIVQAIAVAHEATLDLRPLDHGGLAVQVRFPRARATESVG